MAELIGRPELAAVIARFADRVPEGPVGLAIVGEPGIGKTTAWSEAVRVAQERGYLVLRARPAEAEATLSFAALGDLLGGVLEEVSRGLPEPQVEALEVALLRRKASTPNDPRTTASALVNVLTRLAIDRPIVVAIDDAQWLDPASRRALEFAARRPPARLGILVASRTRSGAGTPLGLDDALGTERLERLALGPLTLAALHHLIARQAIDLARPMLVRVAEASGGNPLYALEIARAIESGGGTTGLNDPLPVPGSLRDLVAARLRRISRQARAAALVAAALSHPTAAIVAAALGPGLDKDAALLEAEEAGILGWEGDRLRFAHPLLASALYGSATTGRRRALHGRLAELVVDPEERARHLARSVIGANEQAAQEIEKGARLADRRGAPEAAADLYEAACRLTPPDRPEDLARRMLDGASALSLSADLRGARSLATRAAETVPPGPLRARALLLLGRLASYTGTTEAGVPYLERALLEAEGDAPLRVEVLLALFEQISIDAAKAAQCAREAIDLLRALDEPDILAQALIRLFIAEAVLGHGAQDRLLDEALAISAGSSPMRDPTGSYSLIWFHWIDDLAATRSRFRVYDELFHDRGDIVGAAEIVEFIAMAEFRAGDWEWAERALEEACATLGQLDLRGPLSASFADRSVIDAHRGRTDRARTTLTDLLGPGRLDAFWRAVCHSAQGAVEFCAGNHEAAVQAWTSMQHEAEGVGWIDFLEDRSEPDHVEALLALGRADEARRVLQHLEWRSRMLPRAWIDATLPRARALVVAAEGNHDAALALLDAAPTDIALPFERARLLLVKGQIQRRANRKLAARESLAAAASIFEELGSPPWTRRVASEIERLGLHHRPPDELSATERRIAELAASGLTNRQVAEAAFVSPKTVEANLARVYQKLGIRSRAELGARIAAEQRDAGTQT